MRLIRIMLLAAIAMILPSAVRAQTAVDPVSQFKAEDGVFMDIAVDLAKASVDKGGEPGGAAIILNGAFHAAGNGSAPELMALQKAHAPSLANAVIYTVNEPITEAWIAISKRGVSKIYFVNSSQDVVAAGIYDAAAYDESSLPQGLEMTPKTKMDYPAAAALIKK